MKRTITITALAAVAMYSASSGIASAQLTGSASSSGLFGGSRSVGGSGGLNAGTRSFTGSQGQTLGAGGSVSGTTQQNLQAGTITGSERFLRGNSSFIGTDSGDVGNTLGILGGQGGNAAGLRNFSRALTSQLPQQIQQDQSGGQSAVPLRITRVIAFQTPTPTQGIGTNVQLSESLSRRLSQMSQRRSGSSVQVEVRGRTAILRGRVASSHVGDLIAQVALLEPGVADVDNQLQVGSAEPSNSAEPPAR